MEAFGCEAAFAEFFGHFIGVIFGFDEDDDRAFAGVELCYEFFIFFALLDADDFLFDVGGDNVCFADRYAFWIGQVFAGEGDDAAW